MDRNKKDNKIEEDDTMSALAQYLQVNKDKAYSFATTNTVYNQQGRPIISKDDEWNNELEWDDLFNILKKEEE